ncbi:hypothetical protein [Macrococcus bovicus]|uniref:Uncharacterized protein n=1 Tax=Macrococcus bovicus TaxID=69968 RepID=A0A4R6C378_9STAP|nr:hypothetical protein [Macrococcus bovicus]TDM15748.1 hypothetical protein ERX55_02245 [Macrococcus bovicus]
MKNPKHALIISIITFILGILCWIPNMFFYHPDNPPLFYLLTPLIGVFGAAVSATISNTFIRLMMIILNILIALSFAIIMFLGTLVFGV